MLGTVFYGITLILSIIGLFFIFGLAVSGLLCKKEERDVYTLIVCGDDYDSLCERVYSAFYAYDFFSISKKRDIVVLGKDIPDMLRRRCEDITAPFGKVYFLSTEELQGDFFSK